VGHNILIINTHNRYKNIQSDNSPPHNFNEGLSLQKHDSLSNNSPPHNFNKGESNGLMPFGGGSKKLATNSSLNSSKNIIDPSSASPTSWLCDPPSRGG